jgi:hypothetical protein
MWSLSFFGQNCNCESNFEWVKKTFEENDAGFDYALKEKGKQAYDMVNKRVSDRVKSAQTTDECRAILFEWLSFFRSGHIGIRLIEDSTQTDPDAKSDESFQDWETYPVETEEFKKYLDGKDKLDFEGIWETGPYKIGIRQMGEEYLGFIIESQTDSWSKGQVKLKFTVSKDKSESVFYMRDHSPSESDKVFLIGKKLLQIGNVNLSRIYPETEDTPEYERYFKMLEADSPYLEKLNETTLYFRIPSFHHGQKHLIDSVIESNRNRILKTDNLIIDIRNGTGGSDSSYKEILPFIYTNPIRTLGVEFLSTKLNNQRMLDFINKPEWGFDESEKQWARESFDKLDGKLGEFVNLNDNDVKITRFDTIHSYPENVGIIINERNGSTDEQFLLAAKQSKKVKLFGTTTFGVLDISNMYFVPSPCNEFELGYSLSRSMRIPGMEIDGKGLQPDYYLDKSVPHHEWVQFVNQVLNE